jgi:hypothetical protein
MQIMGNKTTYGAVKRPTISLYNIRAALFYILHAGYSNNNNIREVLVQKYILL